MTTESLWDRYKFRAFLSYSTADRAAGERFHARLERYKIPRSFRNQQTAHGRIPERLTPIFRDRSDLEAHDDLSARIELALRQSAWLIVLCSPRSAASEWVNKEIATFKRLNGGERIIPVLVSGTPSEYDAGDNPQGAFPPALTRKLDEAGSVTGMLLAVPFAPDLREPTKEHPGGDGERFALLKVVARMTAVGLLELTRRQDEAARAERRLFAWAALVGLVLAAAASAAAWAALGQRNEALRAESRVFARAAHDATGRNWPDRGIWLALHGIPMGERWLPLLDRPMEPAAVARLSEALLHFGTRRRVLARTAEKDITHARFLPDEQILVVLKDSTLVADLRATVPGSRVLSDHAAGPIALSPDRRRVALTHGLRVLVVAIDTGAVLASLEGHTAPIWKVTFSNDGARIATGASDHTGRVWDSRTGRPLATLRGHGAPLEEISWSEDRQRLLTFANDGTARVWESATGEPLHLLRHDDVVTVALFSPSGDVIATTSSGTVLLWELRGGVGARVLKGRAERISAASLSPDGQRLVTASDSPSARIWDLARGEISLTLAHPVDTGLLSVSPDGKYLYSVAFSPDGERVVTAADGGEIRVWDSRTGIPVKVINTVPDRHDRRIVHASYSPGGDKLLAVSAYDVSVLGAAAGSELLTLRGHAGAVHGAAHSPDGRTVVTIHEEWDTVVWDSRSGAKRFALGREAGTAFDVQFNATGDRFLTVSHDHMARYWDARTGRRLLTLHRNGSALKAVAISPDGTSIATAGENGTTLWSAATGAVLATLAAPADAGVTALGFSPDSSHLVTGCDDGSVQVWSVTGTAKHVLTKAHAGEIVRASYSPDGTAILTAAEDGSAREWDARTGVRSRVFDQHGSALSDALYSPDGHLVVTSAIDEVTRLWNAKTGDLVAELRVQAGEFGRTSFSPDSTRLISASQYGDGVAYIWDAATGVPITSLHGHSGAINAARFSPDGRRILTASSDGTARIWDAPRGLDAPALVREACRALDDHGRRFEPEEAADLGTKTSPEGPCGRLALADRNWPLRLRALWSSLSADMPSW